MAKHTTEKPAERRESKYKGVRKRKWGKWVSEIRLPNSRERIWLGSYDSAEKAARAFDAALFCLRGRTSKFNFPNSPPAIAGGSSLSSSEIQAAAARHANGSEAPRSQLDQSSTEPSTSEVRAESPCTSVLSHGTAQLGGSELMLDIPFLDLLANSNMGSDYEMFPDFYDLHNDFFAPPMVTGVEYGEENFDGTLAQDSFLWNF